MFVLKKFSYLKNMNVIVNRIVFSCPVTVDQGLESEKAF